MNVGGRADDPNMTPHTLIENLVKAKAGNPDDYRDYLNTATVALAHRTDLEPLAQVLDQLIADVVSWRVAGDMWDTTDTRTAWTYDRIRGWIDA